MNYIPLLEESKMSLVRSILKDYPHCCTWKFYSSKDEGVFLYIGSGFDECKGFKVMYVFKNKILVDESVEIDRYIPPVISPEKDDSVLWGYPEKNNDDICVIPNCSDLKIIGTLSGNFCEKHLIELIDLPPLEHIEPGLSDSISFKRKQGYFNLYFTTESGDIKRRYNSRLQSDIELFSKEEQKVLQIEIEKEAPIKLYLDNKAMKDLINSGLSSVKNYEYGLTDIIASYI